MTSSGGKSDKMITRGLGMADGFFGTNPALAVPAARQLTSITVSRTKNHPGDRPIIRNFKMGLTMS